MDMQAMRLSANKQTESLWEELSMEIQGMWKMLVEAQNTTGRRQSLGWI
jgi:hypothetical protein